MSKSKKNLLLVALSCIVAFCASVALAVSGNTARAYADTPLVEKAGVENVSLTLADNLVIKYYVPTASLTDDTTATFTMNGVNTDVEGVVEGENYVFAYGVTPQYVGTAIDMSVTESIYVKNYSIKAYCEAILAEKPATVADAQYGYLKELAVDILNYGAAAQTYVDFDVDNLANKDLGENVALATEYGVDLKSVANLEGAGEATWQNVGLYCDSALALYFEIQVPDTQKEYTLKVNGDAANVELESKAGDVYTYIYTGVTPVKFADSVTAQLFDGENAVSGVVTYSVNSYVSAMKESQTAGLADLVKAVYGYGKMAYAYVNYANVEVVETPTETKAGSAKIAGDKYDYDAVELPVLGLDGYTYGGTSVTDGVAKGTFTSKAYACEIESEIAHYLKLFEENNYKTIYDDLSGYALTGEKVVSGDSYVAKIKLAGAIQWGSLDVFGSVPVEFYADVESSMDIVFAPVKVYGEMIIGENVTLNANKWTNGDNGDNKDGVELYGKLTVNGILKAERADDAQDNYNAGIRYQSANASVIINGGLSVVGKGIGVYMNYENNSFTVNEGASVTVNTYGHGIVGNGANNALNVNGGTVSLTASNAILCQYSSLTTVVKAGEVTLNGYAQTQNLAIHGGNIAANKTISVNKFIIKGGALNVNMVAEQGKDEPAIQSLTANSQMRYYFLGGETTLIRDNTANGGSKGSAGAIQSMSNGNNIAFVIGGQPVITASGFNMGARFEGDISRKTFEFTKYGATDSGDTSTTYGFNANGCNSKEHGDWGTWDFWGTVSSADYWNNYGGLNIISYTDIQNQALSAESVAGEVNFANL